MRTERQQDRPSEPANSKAETGKRTPATRDKLAEQLDELEATERALARYGKGARGRKTASARTPAAATKAETGKRMPATRTRSAPRAPGTQNEPEAAAAIEAFKSAFQSALLKELREPEATAIEALKSRAAEDMWLILAGQAGLGKSRLLPQAPDEYELAADVDAILKRLDQGIAAEHAAMDRLLERIVSRTLR